MQSYMQRAEELAVQVPKAMSGLGREPLFSSWGLAVAPDVVAVVATLNVRGLLARAADAQQRFSPAAYTDPKFLHNLSTALRGVRVCAINTDGVRLAFVLSKIPKLPRRAEFPGTERGRVAVGVGLAGPVWTRWEDVRVMLVAGMQGSGKSNFLRLMVHQALADGAALLLSDPHQTTFPMLASSPALLAPIAHSPDETRAIVELAVAECERRAAIYPSVPGFPEGLDEYNEAARKAGGELLPRVMVVLDEFSATAAALGGGRADFCARVAARLGWEGRKFGVRTIFSAQAFPVDLVGGLRQQTDAVVAFQMRGAAMARAIDCPAATRMRVPGRAVTDRWGILQTYRLDKALLVDHAGPTLTAEERALVERAIREAEGRMSIPLLQEWGLAERAARKLVEEFEGRRWLEKRPDQANARYVTEALVKLMEEK
jgi:hypothetical protein